MTYSDVQLYIGGAWRPGGAGDTIDVVNPATEKVIGNVASARTPILRQRLKQRNSDLMIGVAARSTNGRQYCAKLPTY